MKFLSPLLYFATTVGVFIASLRLLLWWEHTIGLEAVWRRGDMEALWITVIVSLVAYALINLVIVSLEKTPTYRIIDHIRITALLYPLVFLFFVWLPFAFPMPQSDAHGYAMMAVLFIASVIGIITNALFLKISNRRKNSTSDGS